MYPAARHPGGRLEHREAVRRGGGAEPTNFAIAGLEAKGKMCA